MELARRRLTGKMNDDTQALVENVDSSDDAADVTEPVNVTVQPGRRIEEETHPLAKRLPRRPTPRCKYLATVAFVSVLGVILVVTAATTLGLWSEKPKETCMDVVNENEYYTGVLFRPESGDLLLCHQGNELLRFRLGVNHRFLRETLEDVYDYDLNSQLALTRLNVSMRGLDHCIMVNWTGMVSYSKPLTDCFNISGNVSWYGGYETYNQIWPMNGDSRPRTPFVPSDYLFNGPSSTLFGPILHPVWMSSSGMVVFVDGSVPLHVSVNDTNSTGEVCLHAAPHSLRCMPGALTSTALRYTVCAFEDLPTATKFFLNESGSVEHTKGEYPEIDVFLHPIWSTWAVYKKEISAEKVTEFAKNIAKYGFNISQLEIDDMFSTLYGALNFSQAKFPDYAAFRNSLSGLNITAWVTPFIDPQPDTELVKEAVMTNRVLPYQNSTQGSSVSLVLWWNGYGLVVNMLDGNARSWMEERLNVFIGTYNLAALKFDAGEETYLPKCVPSVDPIQYVKEYNMFVGKMNYSSRSEMRSAYFGQSQPILYRMLDRNSDWGLNNGLHSVLTTTLALGIAGYPYILPDMIGGNLYNVSSISEELYVRWLQLCAFMPAMQFSLPPWYSSNDTIVTHALNMTRLHTAIVNDFMMPVIQEAAVTGFPIIRPLWWIDPSQTSFTISDEFLIGEDLLVAPILAESQRSRMVYFPTNCWKCMSVTCAQQPPYHQGSHQLDAPLLDILYFKHVNC